jgi:hypothetical protein
MPINCNTVLYFFIGWICGTALFYIWRMLRD